MCIFGGWVPLSARPYPLGFLFLPLLLWPAFRFGPRETALSALLLAGIVVWGTLHGTGPFSPYPPHEALLLLQTYSGVVALTSCTIAALVAEARRARDDLEGRVHERTDELRLSNRNLRAEIDERERMHAALRASEARLLEAQTIAHLGSWEWEVESDSLWWSDELYRIYGLDRRTFQASYDGFLERVHPEDRERVAAAVTGALAGEDLLTFEHRIVRPDGTVRTLAARGRVIRDADGKAVRMLGTGQDITERKRAEHDHAQLREAQAAQRQAEEASKLKDEFLAIVSHELRTPLNAIMGWTRMLATGALGQEAAAKAVEVIERNARAQAGLIDDLLDVSRFMSGQFRLEARPLDVGPVLEAALEAIEPAAAARKLRIESRNDAPAARVLGDPRRMQQIVSNLLSNAVKFSPPGGTVAMEVTTRDSHVVLRVTDTGPGIDPAHVERIFEPFWQADTTYTRSHGGLGLGLAIVRFLVEAHGGAVKVEPREQGASFVVTLPRHLD
jgi:PAS domain S-box-containing protein